MSNNFAAGGSSSGFDDLDALLDGNTALDPIFFYRKQSPSTSATGSRHGSSLFSATSPSNAGTSDPSQSPQSSQGESLTNSDWNEWRDWVDFDWGQTGAPSKSLINGQGIAPTSTFDFNGPAISGSLSEPPLYQTMFNTNGVAAGIPQISPDMLSTFNMDGSNLGVPYFPTSQLSSIAEDPISIEQNLPMDLSVDSSIAQDESAEEENSTKASRSASPASSALPSKKRKLEREDSEGLDSVRPRKGSQERQESQRHHSNIEKRYLNKLNDMIAALRDAVPSLQQGAAGNEEDDKNGSSVTKGRVLSKATEYIVELETKNKKLTEEKALLQKQVMALGKLNGQLMNDQGGKPRRSSGGAMGKVMVGGMAGMLAMQGFGTAESSNEMPSGRGLFALPVHLIGQLSQSMHRLGFASDSAGVNSALHVLRGILLLGAVLYIFLPSLFNAATEPAPSEKVQQATVAEVEEERGAFASPKELRRDAFLTATQSLWVPRKQVQIVLAVILQALKLALSTCGIDPTTLIRLLPLKSSQQDSATTIRSWDTALDAQLSGGDSDVSTGRLLLTFLAAGSLPETPYRLMLRTMHAQMLASKSSGLLRSIMTLFLHSFSRKTWERARALQKDAKDAKDSSDAAALATHLAALLSLDADEVFLDEVVERACDLVEGKPSHDGVAWVDAIANDAAVISPLDFLAARRSAAFLRDLKATYAEVQQDDESDSEANFKEILELATRIAPPRSAVWSRAYVMRALLLEENQRDNISLAFKSLLVAGAQSQVFSYIPADGEPTDEGVKMPSVSPDVAMALTCAIAISRLRTPEEEKALQTLAARLKTTSVEELGLLGCISLYRFLDIVFKEKAAATTHKELCEKLAGVLRVWVREQSKDGDSGMSKQGEKRVAGLCVEVLEWGVGIETAEAR